MGLRYAFPRAMIGLTAGHPRLEALVRIAALPRLPHSCSKRRLRFSQQGIFRRTRSSMRRARHGR